MQSSAGNSMVSKNVQDLYNTYLVISRSSENKPFKLRKDFSDFYETEQFVLIKKIERFLLQHPDIKPEIFFKAPYILHPDQTFNLSFYTTLRAVKMYTMYIKSLDVLPIDHQHTLCCIKQSLQFIEKFCILNKIPLNQYASYTSNQLYPDWFTHIKNRAINKWVLFGFSQIRSIMESVGQSDIVELLIPDLYNNFYSDLTKYNNSVKGKALITKGLNILQKRINIS